MPRTALHGTEPRESLPEVAEPPAPRAPAGGVSIDVGKGKVNIKGLPPGASDED